MAENVKTLDIQGDVCPYTLVKSQHAAEKLGPQEVLEIHLGNSESASNVPRSLDLDGYDVFDVAKAGPTHWVVKVKKGS